MSEWECVHQDNEASMRRVNELTGMLNEMGAKLLQSYEMRSVLREVQLGVGRAGERVQRMRETVAMGREELDQRRQPSQSQSVASRKRPEQEPTAVSSTEAEEGLTQVRWSKSLPGAKGGLERSGAEDTSGC